MVIFFVPLLVVAVVFGLRGWLAGRARPWTWFTLQPAGGAPELDHVVQHAVSAAGRMDGSMVVAVLRTREGVVPYVGVESVGDQGSVNAFAKAVAAVASPAERPLLIAGVGSIAKVNVKHPWTGATSNKGDTAHAAKSLADALGGFGDWVAVVARPQTSREAKAGRDWYGHIDDGPTVQTHPSCAKGAMLAELWAGGAKREVAGHNMMALTQSLAGFDVAVKAVPPSVNDERLVWGLLGGLCTVGAVMAAAPVVGVVACVVAAAVPQVLLVARRDWFGTPRRLARLRAGSPVPVARLGWRHPGYRKERRNDDGTLHSYERNEYPFGDHRVPVGAQHVAMVVAPHAGAASGASVARLSEPPAALCLPGGSLIGTGGTRKVDVLLPDDAPRDIMAIGAPGAGKSSLLRSIFASDCVRKSLGARRAIVVLESQGGREVAKWVDIAAGCGLDALVVDIGDRSTPAIDMFAGEGTPHMRAGRFLDLFFGSDADGTDGGVALTPSLQALLAVALMVTPEVAAAAGVHAGSVIWFASVLAGGQAGGDATAVSLWSRYVDAAHAAEVAAGADPAVALTAAALQRTHMGDSVVRLAPYMAMKETERRREFAPALRRLQNLLSIDSWFAADRPRFTWAELLAAERVVVLNHGDPADSRLAGLEAQWADRLSRMLLAGVETGIRSACRGWDEQGKRVSVFADELSIVAGASPETPEWMRQQARKFGVDVSFATQAEHQLDDKLLGTVLGFPIVMWLPLGGSPKLLELARTYLANEPGGWEEMVTTIPPYHAIVSATSGMVRQPACLVSLEEVSRLPVEVLRRRGGFR